MITQIKKQITQMCIGAIFFLLSCVFFLPVPAAEDIEDFSHAHRAWIDLSTGESHGIKLRFSGRMRSAEVGGKHCVGTSIGDEEQFIYFDIDDTFIYDGNHPVVDVTIEYYDQGKDALNIHFDCKANFYDKNIYAWRGKVIHKTDSKSWKRFTAHLTDARFANRQEHHRLPLTENADLRVHNKYDGSEEYISFVEVKIPYLYISTGKAGNIFGPKETVSLKVKGVNRGPEEKPFALIYEITGFNGKVIERNTLDFKISKNSYSETKIDFKPEDKGIYFANFALKADGNIVETAGTSFAVCDEMAIDAITRYNSPFGVCVGYEELLNENFVSLLEDGGVGWVRFEPVWRDLEVKKGTFRWNPYDRMIGAAAARGLNLYGLLGYGTDWADPTTGVKDAINSFGDYAGALAARYKDKIGFWEIWNEEDWMGFWPPEANPVVYTELLKTASLGLKKADTEAKVIVGGLTGCYKSRGHFKFLTEIYKNRGGPFFDIVAIHPGTAPHPPEKDNTFQNKIKDAYYRMSEFGDADKKIWITELGWPTGRGDVKEHIINERNVNLREQAEYLIRAYIIGLSLGEVEKIFWYCFKNTGYDPDISEQNYGLVNADLSPKPAYIAYRVMASKLSGLNYAGRLDLPEPLRAYIFESKNKTVKVLWSVGINKTLDLPVKEKVVLLTDIMGNTEQVQIMRGKINLLLTESPIFLEEK